jgi:hypothetical protein
MCYNTYIGENMTKLCKTCLLKLDTKLFTKSKDNKDGLRTQCNICRSLKRKNDRAKNPKKWRDYENKYRKANPEAKKAKDKRYRDKHKEQAKTYFKSYYEKNSEIIKERTKKYQMENIEAHREYKKVYQKRRRDEDPIFRIIGNIRHRLNEFLKYEGMKKNSKISQYLGCDKEYLRKYIESQFKPGMTWDNYGSEWHVDHKMPLKTENVTEEQIYERNYYTNLQPMWGSDNIKKSNKLPDESDI